MSDPIESESARMAVIGSQIVKLLKLRKLGGFYKTGCGTKTEIGLARLIERLYYGEKLV